MQKHGPTRWLGPMGALLALLISGCGSINPAPTAVPDGAQPAPISTFPATWTPRPATQPAPEITPTHPEAVQPTGTSLATALPAGPTLPADASCLPAEIDAYMNAVLPLTDEHAVDSFEAQKMAALTDEARILALRNRAATRLESMRGIQAPPCLQEAHAKITQGFELLISTWDLIRAKDYSTATTTLQESYAALSGGLAEIVILRQG